MRYFLLDDDMSGRQRARWHVGEVFLPDGTEPWLSGGILLRDPRPLHAYVTHMGHVLDFCTTSFGVPIATQELANVIAALAVFDVQTIPVTISNQTGIVVLNSVRVIECVDEPRSKFEKYAPNDPVRPDKAGDYRYFEKLVLARQAVPHDAHFFRIKGYLIHIIVSETVKNAMERVGCYGAKFTELEMA